MEPIDYKRAVTRRWPLILVCAVVAAIIAVLIPVHQSATASETTYQVQALTGIPPSRTSNANALSAEISQIEFYAEQQPVYAEAFTQCLFCFDAGISGEPVGLGGDHGEAPSNAA